MPLEPVTTLGLSIPCAAAGLWAVARTVHGGGAPFVLGTALAGGATGTALGFALTAAGIGDAVCVLIMLVSSMVAALATAALVRGRRSGPATGAQPVEDDLG